MLIKVQDNLSALICMRGSKMQPCDEFVNQGEAAQCASGACRSFNAFSQSTVIAVIKEHHL
jgi:hypothetical protein